MIQIIPSKERHFADHGWLATYWHFSFSEYYNPENMNWSVLRVFNDDIVQPQNGFPMHPHRDMEIVTYVISGELEHQDRLGNRGVVHPGEVQVMSAGKGIVHAELNPSSDTPVHLLQLWILPRNKGNQPRWEQKQFSAEERGGKWLAVVSGGAKADTLAIDQDAVIYVARLEAEEKISHAGGEGRHAYLFVISGDISLNGETLAAGDQARIAGETKLDVTSHGQSELMLLDLP